MGMGCTECVNVGEGMLIFFGWSLSGSFKQPTPHGGRAYLRLGPLWCFPFILEQLPDLT